MGRIILATGRIAGKPYKMRLIDRNIYTVEELCYSLAQCASFLDDDIMDHELLVWLEQECGLSELAAQLRSLLRGRCTVEDFVSLILLYVGYQETDEIERIRSLISAGRGLEPFQRRLQEARLCASSGRGTQALDLMDDILDELPELEREMRGRIWAEKGKIYADRFQFKEAASCYGRAWELSTGRQYCVCCLAALFFSLSGQEYQEFLAAHPDMEDADREMQSAVAEADRRFRQSSAGRQLGRLRSCLDRGQERTFDNNTRQRVRELRDEFRAGNAPSF